MPKKSYTNKTAKKRKILSRTHYKTTAPKKSRYGTDPGTVGIKHAVGHQSRTAYAETLINPEMQLEVRIPDMSCYPTACFTAEKHISYPVIKYNDTTDNCILVVPLQGNPGIEYFQGYYSNQSGGTGTPGNKSTGNSNPASNFNPVLSSISTKFMSARLVSAILKVTWAGNDSQTSGHIYGAHVVSTNTMTGATQLNGTDVYRNSTWNGTLGATLANPPLYDKAAWARLPDFHSGPMSKGVCLRYKPVDASAFSMDTVFSDTQLDITGSNPTGQGAAKGLPCPYGAFVVMVDPTAASTGSGLTAAELQLDLVLNYEGIPWFNDIGIPTAVSASDGSALSHGLNIAGRSNSCFPATEYHSNIHGPLRLI